MRIWKNIVEGIVENLKTTVRNLLEDPETTCFLQDSQAAEKQTGPGWLFPLSPPSCLHLPCVSFDGLENDGEKDFISSQMERVKYEIYKANDC